MAYYANGAAHFEHQDWLGTERMRTTYNGGVEGSYISLPFGDGRGTTGTDLDANHYALLDYDAETATDHAQFRQYSNTQGRWLAPNPYSGSYSMRNPQSFNRYVYAGNNPLAATDPSGMDDCGLGSMANGLCYSSDTPVNGGGVGDYGGMGSFGGGWGDVFSTVDCQIEGMDVPCGIAYSAARSGGAVQCPNNECGWTNIGGVAAHVVAYQTGIAYVPAGGVDSKYSTKDQATIAGALYQYSQYLLNGSKGNPITVYQTADGMFSYTDGSDPNDDSIFNHWPLNGDLLPGIWSLPDYKCSAGPVIGPLLDSNPGMKSACIWHDNMYAEYQCNASSWIPVIPGPCTVFNIVLVVRLIGALF